MPKVTRKRSSNHFTRHLSARYLIAIALFLSSVIFVMMTQVQTISNPSFAQFLYPTPTGPTSCAVNVACGCAPYAATIANYYNCDPGNCPGDSCSINYGCTTVLGCDAGTCHPTKCTPVCGLGGCPGGCGSEDDCGGVSCDSCGGPTPTTTITTTPGGGPYCGDGVCNGGETCSGCAGDCGACPPPGSCITMYYCRTDLKQCYSTTDTYNLSTLFRLT